jgi:hypothetical protein
MKRRKLIDDLRIGRIRGVEFSAASGIECGKQRFDRCRRAGRRRGYGGRAHSERESKRYNE